ncbi:hypothetical protein TrRE_jg12297, partial [Triparma retinervis]
FWSGKHVISIAHRNDQSGGESGELFLLSVVAYALLMATVTEECELSLEAGALFAGIVLMKSGHLNQVITVIKPITSMFGGMYLTSLGMIISPTFVSQKIFEIAGLTLAIGGGKFAIASSVLRHGLRCSGEVGVGFGSSMAQISEGSLVLLAKAQQLGFVNRHTYLTLIPVCCILLSVSPFSATIMKRLKNVGNHSRGEGEKEDRSGGGKNGFGFPSGKSRSGSGLGRRKAYEDEK